MLFTVVFMNFLYGQPRKCPVAGVMGCVFVCPVNFSVAKIPLFPSVSGLPGGC